MFARPYWKLPWLVKHLVGVVAAIALFFAVLVPFIFVGYTFKIKSDVFLGSFFVWAPLSFIGGYFIGKRLIGVFANPRAALAIEQAANYDSKGVSRMLVIRGVDDEASLSLAAGSISARFGHLALVAGVPTMLFLGTFLGYLAAMLEWAKILAGFLSAGAFLGALLLPFVTGVLKSVFGREFLINALVCDIAVDSVPDTWGHVDAITLRPALSAKPLWDKLPIFDDEGRLRVNSWELRLRHGIYNHPQCVDVIMRWLRIIAP